MSKKVLLTRSYEYVGLMGKRVFRSVITPRVVYIDVKLGKKEKASRVFSAIITENHHHTYTATHHGVSPYYSSWSMYHQVR